MMIVRYKRQVHKRQVNCLKGNYYDTEIQETGQVFEEQLL